MNRRILLIDADSTIPNLALMRLSAYHKSIGSEVELLRLNLPYYPNKKKQFHDIDTQGYNHVFCSVIFEGNLPFISGKNIEFGGTGTKDITKCLPNEIEKLKPDYSIYPKNNIAYGFITRGCIRNCYFCKVPKKEGYIHQVANVSDVYDPRMNRIEFLDNNILAFSKHEDILKELIDRQIKCSFNQGLDIRLVTEKNSNLLFKLNHVPEYIFAFDDIKYMDLIKSKLELLQWRKDWQLKFYVYVNPNMTLSDTIKRIKFLRERKLLPYIMRDIACWGSEKKNFYTDLASWCNQPGIFKKMRFDEFLKRRHTNSDRIRTSLELWEQTK